MTINPKFAEQSLHNYASRLSTLSTPDYPPATTAALAKSIELWEQRAQGLLGIATCPLCVLHIDNQSIPCAGCPVRLRTKQSGCRNTPYVEWNNAFHESSSPSPEKDPHVMHHAKRELIFLRSLRK